MDGLAVGVVPTLSLTRPPIASTTRVIYDARAAFGGHGWLAGGRPPDQANCTFGLSVTRPCGRAAYKPRPATVRLFFCNAKKTRLTEATGSSIMSAKDSREDAFGPSVPEEGVVQYVRPFVTCLWVTLVRGKLNAVDVFFRLGARRSQKL